MSGTPLLAVSTSTWILLIVLAAVAGGIATAAVVVAIGKWRVLTGRRESDRILADAKRDSEQIIKTAELDARTEQNRLLDQFKVETAETRAELKGIEKRLVKREDTLDSKLETLATKERHLERSEAKLAERGTKLQESERRVEELGERREAELVRISGLTAEAAKQELLGALEEELTHEAGQLINKIIGEAQENAMVQAREITLTAIQRYAADITCEGTVSTVDIPSDDMKGRVIGREGRNIRAFEKTTGVDVIVDDTPGVVVVSSFDPVRREMARITLEKLIQDGRIHPGRIEELYAQTRKEVEKEILETGKKAALEANVPGLHRKQMDLLGRLRYRTSYGQNVLKHSIEVAYLCQVMADELKLDGRLARRCGLLHDIGKAVDHEVEGGHPQIGADLCKRLNERPEVVNAVAGHHGDVEATSPYTPLVAAADAISAARPGGRRESLERYVKRLEQLEALALGHPGVKEAFAIQAGREVRVIVDAGRLDDASTTKLARDVALQIEEEMTYPGEVKITVLREMRAVEYAR